VTVSVFATGLYNPRGLKFGPDGYLYVAEGGKGGTHSTAGKCEQVIAPVGPYKGSYSGSGRISRIDPNGVRTTVTKQLPSSQTSMDLGSFVSGVGDVAFIGNTLYAILAGPAVRMAWKAGTMRWCASRRGAFRASLQTSANTRSRIRCRIPQRATSNPTAPGTA
jgi:hypothetical protein